MAVTPFGAAFISGSGAGDYGDRGRAWAWLRNVDSLSTSSRIRPLQLSTHPFCMGCPDAMSRPVIAGLPRRSTRAATSRCPGSAATSPSTTALAPFCAWQKSARSSLPRPPAVRSDSIVPRRETGPCPDNPGHLCPIPRFPPGRRAIPAVCACPQSPVMTGAPCDL